MILVLSVTNSLIISASKSSLGFIFAAIILTSFCSAIICHGTMFA